MTAPGRGRGSIAGPEARRPPRPVRHPPCPVSRIRLCACGLPTWSQKSPYCREHKLEAELRRAARTRTRKQTPKTPAQIMRERERERRRKRKRPSTNARGYGTEHQARRRRIEKIVKSGLAICARCGRAILPTQDWDLGHDDLDRSLYSGTRAPVREGLPGGRQPRNGAARGTPATKGIEESVSARPKIAELLDRPGAMLSRSDLHELGWERRAVDAIFRELDVVFRRATRAATSVGRTTSSCWSGRLIGATGPGRLDAYG